MAKKYAIFLFNDDEMCMLHVFLYLRELNERGCEAKLIIEGKATVIPAKYAEGSIISRHYQEAKERGWIDCICKACSAKMGSLKDAEREGLNVCSDLNGHVSLARYIDEGYEVLVF